MSNSPITIIRPTGHQKQRLRANANLDAYSVDGTVESAEVSTPTGMLPVWQFHYSDIREEAVKVHMLKETMGKRGMTLKEALAYLVRVPCAVPQDQVQIEVIE